VNRPLVIAVVAVSAALGFAPQAMAAHVSCGDVITQHTVLDSDLADCPGNGVQVADGVTLDLAGHTIDGQGSGFGVSAVPPAFGQGNGVRVRNGTVREFGDGLHLERAIGTFERLVLAGNENAGVRCVDGGFPRATTLSEVEAQGNSTGVGADGCLIGMTRSSIHGNSGDGLSVGFSVFDVSDSAVFENGGFGAVFSSANSTFATTAVYSNGSTGLLFAVGNVTVRGNTFVANGGNGVDIEFGTTSTVRENITASNDANGIRLDEDGTHVARANTSTRNGADGILVEPRARFELTGNRADSNGDDGIDADDPDGTITDNRADRNADLGIEALPGVSDGGGNRAKQNGNRLQCLNVVCRK
jgi:hypothetical protein